MNTNRGGSACAMTSTEIRVERSKTQAEESGGSSPLSSTSFSQVEEVD